MLQLTRRDGLQCLENYLYFFFMYMLVYGARIGKMKANG